MSRIFFDEPPWWHQPRWQLVAAAVLAVVALAVWWTALAPVDHEPIVVRAPAPSSVVARSATPAPMAPAARAAPAPPRDTAPEPGDAAAPPDAAPASRTVAPGVRITPLNLPPGLLQIPADQPSEENLEN
jgi:hypothetical protein